MDLDDDKNSYEFFHLNSIFIKYECIYWNIYKDIENDIKTFNENYAQLFLKYKDKIENENRKKRFIKHFTNLRNSFISYQKLKLIIIIMNRKNPNMNLIKLYKHYKKYKLGFKKFIFSKDLSLDKNISKSSNFFATQKPLFFEEIDKIEKINKKTFIENYIKDENIEETSKESSNSKLNLEKADIWIEFNNENEARNYINSRNVFQFKDNNEINIYPIKFNGNFSKEKIKFFKIEDDNKSIFARCKPLYRLKSGKWLFYYRGNKAWIFLLNQNLKNEYELEMINEIGYYYELFEIKEDIFLIRQKTDDIIYDINPIHHLKMNVFNSKTFNKKKTMVIPFDSVIENIFYLDKYKNIVFIFLLYPLLNLIIFDFELNQINTIINLMKPYYQENIVRFRPKIKEIKVLKNNRLYIIGRQSIIKINDPENDKHEFILIYNLNNFDIEYGAKYYISDKEHYISEVDNID